MHEPSSLLTVQRPDIWRRALDLATAQTGLRFLPKHPLADGTLYACGGYGYPPRYSPPPPETDKEREERERRERIKELERELEELRRKNLAPPAPVLGAVYVPEGAMEWLLHEVGHFLASTLEERLRPNHGVGQELWGRAAEQEVQAWAFEHIVLAPLGNARMFAPPSQRDGAAFRPGPLPSAALHHMERRAAAEGVDLDRWRALYTEWVRWGRGLGPRAPWESEH